MEEITLPSPFLYILERVAEAVCKASQGAREFSGKSMPPEAGGPRTKGMNFSSSPGGAQRQ